MVRMGSIENARFPGLNPREAVAPGNGWMGFEGILNRREQDRRIFRKLIGGLDTKKPSAISPGQLMLEIGKYFIGTPYAEGTLKAKGAERLVVNLREFDCVTFVENVVALALCVKSRKKPFEDFRKQLQRTRYRVAPGSWLQGSRRGNSCRSHPKPGDILIPLITCSAAGESSRWKSFLL